MRCTYLRSMLCSDQSPLVNRIHRSTVTSAESHFVAWFSPFALHHQFVPLGTQTALCITWTRTNSRTAFLLILISENICCSLLLCTACPLTAWTEKRKPVNLSCPGTYSHAWNMLYWERLKTQNPTDPRRTCLEFIIFSTTEVPMLVAAPTDDVASPAEKNIFFVRFQSFKQLLIEIYNNKLIYTNIRSPTLILH